MNDVIKAILRKFANELQHVEVTQDFIDYRNAAAVKYKTYGRKLSQMQMNCDYLWLEWNLFKSGLVGAPEVGNISYDCYLKEDPSIKLELKGLTGKYFNIHPTGPCGFGGIEWLKKNISEKNFTHMVFWQFLEDFGKRPLKVGDVVSVHVASVEAGKDIWIGKIRSQYEVGGYWYPVKGLTTRRELK